MRYNHCYECYWSTSREISSESSRIPDRDFDEQVEGKISGQEKTDELKKRSKNILKKWRKNG